MLRTKRLGVDMLLATFSSGKQRKSMRLIVVFLTLATTPDVASQVISIQYDFTSNLKGIPITRESHLVYDVKERRSLYYHSRGEGIVAVDRNGNVGDVNMTVPSDGKSKGPSIDFYRADSIGNVVLSDLTEDKMVVREFVYMRAFTYEEPGIPQIDWFYVDTMANILGKNCSLATGHFRGREYKVWFDKEVPISVGPWKLMGIPGLLVYAHDERHEITFRLKKLSITEETTPFYSQMYLFANGIEIDFHEAKDIYQKEQLRMVRSQSSTQDRTQHKLDYVEFPTMEIFKKD